jgi:RND family efflux transporter MFP subunit
MTRHPRPLLAAPLVAASTLAALLLAGCAGKREAAREAEAAGTPIAVTTALVGQAPAGGDLVLPARIKAREEVTLAARVPGRLTDLPVAEGAAFRRGQPLAVFDAPEARDANRAAAAAVAAARVRLETARLQETRMESLYGQRVAALHELETARAERQAAESDHAAALAAAARISSGTSLTAPFDGIMVRHRVDAGAEVAPGQPLADIRSSQGGSEIVVAVPESKVPLVASKGGVWFQVGDGSWQAARVERLEGMTDYSSRTRTAHLIPAAAPALDLEPGAFARVRFAAAGSEGPRSDGTGRDSVSAAHPIGIPSRLPASPATPSSYRVPLSGLVRRGELVGVYVVEDGRARLRWVRLGRQDGDGVEVLAGLWPGERVVVRPGALADGARVTVEP